MKIRSRIISLVTMLLLMMVAGAVFSLAELKKLGRETQELTEILLPIAEVMIKITNYGQAQTTSFERGLRFVLHSSQDDPSIKIPFDETRAEFDRLSNLLHEALLQVDNIFRPQLKGQLSQSLANELKETQAAFLATMDAYLEYETRARGIFRLLSEKRFVDAEVEALAITGEEDRLQQSLETLLLNIESLSERSSTRAKNTEQTALRGTIFLSLLALIWGFTVAFLITTSITRPLGVAVKVANEIALGNKQIEIPTIEKGEIGQLLTAMRDMRDAVTRSELQLQKHAEELARSNAELEQFAYVASHDLQEPLRMISSYTQLLAKRYKGQLDESADEFIKFAVDGVQRMQRLINDLLTFSRVGRQQDYKQVKIADVLDNCRRLLKVLIEENDATITHDPLPEVYGNEVMLNQLFQNLLTNAIKFRSTNHPIIEISITRQGHFYQFTFKDNGIGFDPQFSERIFQVFQRLHPADKYEGTGIGLAICKKIVEQHGGKIRAESLPGNGATFVFTLPAFDLKTSR